MGGYDGMVRKEDQPETDAVDFLKQRRSIERVMKITSSI